jgi:hypothetical protein
MNQLSAMGVLPDELKPGAARLLLQRMAGGNQAK